MACASPQMSLPVPTASAFAWASECILSSGLLGVWTSLTQHRKQGHLQTGVGLGSGEIFSMTKDISHHQWQSVVGMRDSQEVPSLPPHVALCWDSVDSDHTEKFTCRIWSWKRSPCISTTHQSPAQQACPTVLVLDPQARVKLATSGLM